jgi:Na+-translocating ferredoxin:NAD+ oxidoreductase RnfD subunit
MNAVEPAYRATSQQPATLHHWRNIPVVLPNRRDPRLRVAAIIIALQILGQVALGFKVSIAQILVTITLCALIEIVIAFAKQRALVWPASALLTGNGVAFVLRVYGTRHGDWWTLRGIQYFLLAACVGLLSKYVLTHGERHYYNPSNLGLVACFLLIGSPRVYPQYLWWGPLDPAVLGALAVILGGVVWVLRPIGMLPMAAGFLVPFYALIAAWAVVGRHFLAIWHTGPVSGWNYWSAICLSPEVLIFVFYMMSDPRTAPRDRLGRIVYGALTAALAAALIVIQPTEYGVKVGILVALTSVCSLVPLIERLLSNRGRPRVTAHPRLRLTPVIVAVILITISTPVAVWQMSHQSDLINVERGISPTGAPTQ